MGLGKAEIDQGPVEKVAGIVASKRPAGAVGAVLAGRQADDAARAAMKRGAANLVIIVDQFEEFFTNPENYQHGVPSPDSNLVLNVLLETARIALEEDMPVYIVFTMRSDYIGQCAAFRGLPEYIGFSQFFVPRLNRAELQQVIEEPALLSGNRITRRLTERLIHDITEGVDQLPILQHALNQIWHAANNGSEEMDLIHYAMVGGMPVSELPDEQVARFNQWFASLPSPIKACYHQPNLQNVLDTHTNKLYEQVGEYCVPVTRQTISHDDAKVIINDLNFFYGKQHALKAIKMNILEKKVTAFIGPSGCGKSTLLRTLNRMYQLYPGQVAQGEIIVDGVNILDNKQDINMLRARMGMVFQKPTPFPMSIYDNVAFGVKLYESLNRNEMMERVEWALQKAALWDEVKDKLDHSGISLSGGQQQRLCIARAIAVKPEVVLLDEPTSALDPISTAHIEDLIFQLKQDYTIAIVTHNMQQAARVSDYTAYMYLGDLIEFGDTSSVFTNPKRKETEDYITGRYG